MADSVGVTGDVAGVDSGDPWSTVVSGERSSDIAYNLPGVCLSLFGTWAIRVSGVPFSDVGSLSRSAR